MRADVLLHLYGHCESRTLAGKLIREGRVFANGIKVKKPSEELETFCLIEVKDSPLTRYVSRGGLKLEAALDAFSIDVEGKVFCDIGASTGGFSHCMLQRGAKKAYCVDVGTAQLHPKLRFDKRVAVMENTNARELGRDSFPEAVQMVVMDVSFISQALLYDAVFDILPEGGEFVSLIKPQFEVGRENLGKNGIVKKPAAIQSACHGLKLKLEERGFEIKGIIESPIEGGDGNKEFLQYSVKRKKET